MVIRSFANLVMKNKSGARPAREASGRMPPPRGQMAIVKGGRRKPSLSLQWASIALASVATAFIPAPSQAAQAALGCPGTVQTGAQFVTEVTVDVGTTPLGSYSIAVTYDPAVLTVASVAGGSTAQFSGSPTTNTPTPGTTNLSAFQSSSLTMPTGVV